MRIPDASEVGPLVDSIRWPRFARVRYSPEAPSVNDIEQSARRAVRRISIDGKRGDRVGVGVGSRGIFKIDVIVESAIKELRAAGYDPVIIPAMGSHGGATATGQRDVLETLGITPDRLDCPIDARMDTTVIGTTKIGDTSVDIHLARAALEVDWVVPINRVKPHTGFGGPVQSGLCKMLVIGLGKQPGARTAHRTVVTTGFEAFIRAALPIVLEATRVPGGVSIVENFEDRTADIEALPGEDLIEAESNLLDRAIAYFPQLPFDRLDILVVDNIGKDVSGTGMDTNVIGRSDLTQNPSIDAPEIGRIYVRGLTEETHGNANGIGLADVIHRNIARNIDLTATYTNALTSGALGSAGMPMLLPTDKIALNAMCASTGITDPATARVAWIEDTGSLASFRVTEHLLRESGVQGMSVTGYDELHFDENGSARFSPE